MPGKYITILLTAALLSQGAAFAKVSVVSATEDLAYFAREIGGEYVKVTTIASPNLDPHFVEVRPSYMMKMRKADIALKVGLELDLWMDKIIDGSRNSDITIVDCSEHIRALEIPTFKPDASHGDLHRFGNPHYWMNPANAPLFAKSILDALSARDASHRPVFSARYDSLMARIATATDEIKESAAMLDGKEIIFYHNAWPYFCEFLGLKAVEFIEPYPGVPPTPTHMAELSEIIKDHGIKGLGFSVYFDPRAVEKLASENGIKAVKLYPSLGARSKNETYVEWMRGNVEALVEVMQ